MSDRTVQLTETELEDLLRRAAEAGAERGVERALRERDPEQPTSRRKHARSQRSRPTQEHHEIAARLHRRKGTR